MSQDLAIGLAAFLNTSLVDLYFRIFNGHTQVNATDLRSLRYPNRAQLEQLGRIADLTRLKQQDLDHLFERMIPLMTDDLHPVAATAKINEALAILRQLELPKEQQNERSALTLLALLDLKPTTAWAEATAPLLGITRMMAFFEQHYGKKYAPNTRETVRRYTVHQFVQAGLVRPNPDKPRPINSPNYAYQIAPDALKLLREFGTAQWTHHLSDYLTAQQTLQAQYAAAREMQRVPVTIAADQEISLSPGGQNVLIKQVIEEFCSRFTPGGQLIYVGDAQRKWAYFDEAALKSLSVDPFDKHGKMPDILVYHTAKNWLVLIEAVTSHGPIDPKRKIELQALFAASTAGVVFVTAFTDRKTLLQYLNDIAWGTEVWLAETPTHPLDSFQWRPFSWPSGIRLLYQYTGTTAKQYTSLLFCLPLPPGPYRPNGNVVDPRQFDPMLLHR